MMNMAKDFNMQIIDDFDFILEEKGNSFTALRKLKWSENSTVRLDIRRYIINSEGDEVTGKGVGFLTEDGPDELVKVLVENDYGVTSEILSAIEGRDEFIVSLKRVLSDEKLEELNNVTIEEEEEDEEVYYDPRELV